MQFRCSVCVLSSEEGVHAKSLHLENHMLSQHKPATLHTGAKLVLEQSIIILQFQLFSQTESLAHSEPCKLQIPGVCSMPYSRHLLPKLLLMRSESVLTESPLVRILC